VFKKLLKFKFDDAENIKNNVNILKIYFLGFCCFFSIFDFSKTY